MKNQSEKQNPSMEKDTPPVIGKVRAFLGSTKGQILSLALFLSGTVSGAYIEKLVEAINPEFFGPSLEALIEKQQFENNFSAIHEKLGRLTGGASADRSNLREEINDLLSEQQEHFNELKDRLKSSAEQLQRSKEKVLKGVAAEADFELKTNKAVTLAERGNVFATLRIFHKNAQLISTQLNGKKYRMSVGSQIPLTTNAEECVISYVGGDFERQLTRFNMKCDAKG